MTTLEEAYEYELKCYYRYIAEISGSQVESTDLKNRRISPKRVREALAAWREATARLRELGSPDDVRRMLAQRGEARAQKKESA